MSFNILVIRKRNKQKKKRQCVEAETSDYDRCDAGVEDSQEGKRLLLKSLTDLPQNQRSENLLSSFTPHQKHSLAHEIRKRPKPLQHE